MDEGQWKMEEVGWLAALPASRFYGVRWSDRRHLPGYAAAVVLFAMAFGLRWILADSLPPGFPFLTFFPAVFVIAYVFGAWPGTLIALLSVVATHYFFVAPLYTWVAGPEKLLVQGFFTVSLAAYIGVIQLMNGTLAEAQALRRAAAEQAAYEHLISRELDHRIKNLFAIVASVIKLSSRHAETPAELSEDAIERIMALGRSHASLLRIGRGDQATVKSIADLVLEPHMLEKPGRFRISGHSPPLDIQKFQVLTLIFHELATNSVKYGALATANGTVDLSSVVAGDQDVMIHWRETNLEDRASVPPQKGFGTELIERLMRSVGGEFSRTYEDGELLVTVRLPVGAASPSLAL